MRRSVTPPNWGPVPIEWGEPARKAASEALAQWGNYRSSHQAEPLPRAHDLDLLDHKVEPTGLAAARCEQQKPKEKLQSA